LEIYAPAFEVEQWDSEIAGASAVEINYGAAQDLQLTLGLPVAWAHDDMGWTGGAGDVEMSAKYRFLNHEATGLQIAIFPGISLPTATKGLGAGKVTGLLPIWAQQDLGRWSIFGGGGYAINPGTGNRDYWSQGLAVTRHMNERLLLGLEVNRQSSDSVDGHGSTSLGVGLIYDLKSPFRILASGGPIIEHGTGKTGYHMFLALGIDY